jgi:hypothetical protein
MRQTQYAMYFFYQKLPLGTFKDAKTFIADQFGFNRAFINILRSNDGHICYPLFQDQYNNYIIFKVKDKSYSCINGELQPTEREKVK